MSYFMIVVARTLLGPRGEPDTGVPAALARWGGVARPTTEMDYAGGVAVLRGGLKNGVWTTVAPTK